MANNSILEVKLDAFEGPLDLLLHLIEKNQVNIYDIPIILITEQYMDYINMMQKQDIDLMSEFLVMAAWLLKIKSKMLLPKEEDNTEQEEDPRAELVQRLIEHKMYKYISVELKERQSDASLVVFKKPTIPDEVKQYDEPVDPAQLLSGITLAKLQNIFNMVIKKQDEKLDPIRSKFGNIEREEINLVDKISYIDEYGKTNKKFKFRTLLEKGFDKVDIIVTFLGVLELIRMGRIFVSQDCVTDDIEIEYNDNCEELDSNYDISFN